MTIDVNFRVFLKKDVTRVGTVIEIHQQSGKSTTKVYKINWDDKYILELNPEKLYKPKEITELYKLKTLSETERTCALNERNKTVECNVKQNWKSQKHNHTQNINRSVDEYQETSCQTINSLTVATTIKIELASLHAHSGEVQNFLKIEPKHKRHLFCQYDKEPQVFRSLDRYYSSNNFNCDDKFDDDDEIYNPQFECITKGLMRFYVDCFSFKVLFQENLIGRLNQDLREFQLIDETRTTASKQSITELNAITDLLKLSSINCNLDDDDADQVI